MHQFLKTNSSVGLPIKKTFLDSRSNRRLITLYDLTKRVELACRFLGKIPKPKNVKDLFLRIKEEYFEVVPPHEGSKKKLKLLKVRTEKKKLWRHKIILKLLG